MASKAAKKRDRKSRITTLTPEQMAARRERAELDKAQREAVARTDAKQPDRWGLNTQALALPVNAETTVRTDAAGRPRGAYRSNPFKLLADSGTLSQDEANAAFDVLAIYAASKGLDGAPERSGIVVDGGNPDAWGAEDRRQWSIKLYGMIIDSLTPKSAKLASAFAYSLIEQDRPVMWRGIVERELGETKRDGQTVRVQVMCEELVTVVPECRKEIGRLSDLAE